MLVTTSSEFQDDARLARTALEALAGEPYRVVVTVPSRDPGEFTVPSNARVLPFVSHGPVLERAACAVTHGGMGATQKALSYGVPVRLRAAVAEAIGLSDGAQRVADAYRAAGGAVAAADAFEETLAKNSRTSAA